MTHTVIIVGEKQREFAHKLVSQAPVGYVVSVKPQTRSGEQNALMWALLTEISKAKPHGRQHTPETFKLLFMHALGHACAFEMGLNGEPFPVGFRSSKLSKQQMSDLIEYIRAYAAEAGLQLRE
ncbi:MAG: recombination protein NinB [Aquidulcibacter sp.]|jgi:hypothetical protein